MILLLSYIICACFIVGAATALTVSMMSSSSTPPRRVIVAGAGVVGTSTAYYLAKEFQVPVTLVDPTGEIAPAASGKAGGFLALDWNDYSSVGPLTRRSFQLHQEIADHVGASKIQYRRLTCASIEVADTKRNNKPSGKKLQGIEWAEGSNAMGSARSLGTEETIAQVHPKKLCQALFDETQRLAPGSELLQGKVVSPIHEDGRLVGVNMLKTGDQRDQGRDQDDDTVSIQGDALVYACGPWTASNIFGTKYHSLVVPTRKQLTQCVFFSGCGDPEVYVRPDNTAYLTGFPDPAIRVTEQPGNESVRRDVIEKIRESVIRASSCTDDMIFSATDGNSKAENEETKGEVEQACYLPSTSDGIPMIGEVPGQPGAFVASGHSCWGILNGPATGEAMAHLIMNGISPHVNLSPFDPKRFGSLQMVP